MNLVKQAPNESFFNIRIKLKVYTLANPKKHNWLNNKLREIGEPPAILDTTSIKYSEQRILSYLNTKGYYESEISTKIVPKINKKKVKAIYNVHLKTPMRIDKVKYIIRDDSLKELLRNWENESLIKPNEIFDVSVLENERSSLTKKIQDAGYFSFSQESISFMIDTSMTSHKMNITLSVRKQRGQDPDSVGKVIYYPHKKYTINKVTFFTQPRNFKSEKHLDTLVYEDKENRILQPYFFIYQDKLTVTPKTLLQKTFLTPGANFSLTNVKKSYENLADLKIFSYTNIDFSEPKYDSGVSFENRNLLNCRIQLIQMPVLGFTVDAEATSSSNAPGLATNLSIQNKNMFRGGEVFSIRLRGAFEVQSSLGDKIGWDIFNTFEARADATLEIPRFLAPIRLDLFSKYFRPKTVLNMGYNYQIKPEYSRTIVNASLGYNWRFGKLNHLFVPFEVNGVKLYAKKEFSNTIDSLTQNNKRLKYQYEDHFIINTHYYFIYNGQIPNKPIDFNFFKLGVEAAGNLLNWGYHIAKAPKNEHGQYEIFGLAFSQYFKTQADFKRYTYFGAKNVLVSRIMAGVGTYYGNGKSMPYEKSFFVGGNNTIRAWKLYRLGPGSYYDPTKPDIERFGDITIVMNLEHRLPILGALNCAFFLDAGNIWLLNENADFPKGHFKWKGFISDIALGGGFGLRYDFGFFVIRLDAALPFRDPVKPKNEKWVMQKWQTKDILFNFGIGYPF